jgi:hypothetical protein
LKQKTKDNRSKSKNTKPTIIKLTTKTKRNQWGEMNKQTRNKTNKLKVQEQ